MGTDEFKFENLKAGDIVESRTGKRYRLTETDDVRPGHHLWWAVPTTGSGRKRRLGRRDFTIEGGWMLDTEGGFPDEQQAADEATAVSARPVIVDYGVSVNGRTKHLIAADNFVHLGAHRIGGALCTRPVRSIIPSRYIDSRTEPGTGGIEMNGLIDRMSECGPCRKVADRYGAITREQQRTADVAAVQQMVAHHAEQVAADPTLTAEAETLISELDATQDSTERDIIDYGITKAGATRHYVHAVDGHKSLCGRTVQQVLKSLYGPTGIERGGAVDLMTECGSCLRVLSGYLCPWAPGTPTGRPETREDRKRRLAAEAIAEQDRLGRDRTDGDAFERFEAAHAEQDAYADQVVADVTRGVAEVRAEQDRLGLRPSRFAPPGAEWQPSEHRLLGRKFQADHAEQASRERAACEGMRPGHVHCKHGHVHDCPDPGNCEVIWPAECAECAQHVLTDEIMPTLTLRKGDVIQATLINGTTIRLQLSFSPTLPTHPRKAGQYVVAGVRVDTGISHYTGQQYIHGHGITIIQADREQQVAQVAIPEPPADPQLAEIKQAVSYGVTVLDALRPGWWRRLDVGRLDVASGSMCVLAQLREGPVGTLDTDNPYDDVRTMLLDELMADTRAAVRPEDYEWSISHGFSNDVRWEGDCWDQLTDAWTDVVVARRVADRPQDRADDAAAEREQLLTGIDLSDISVFAVLARAQFESAGSRAIFDGAGQSADTGERYGSDPGRLTFLAGLGLLDVRTVDGYTQVMLLDKGVRLARCLGISPRP